MIKRSHQLLYLVILLHFYYIHVLLADLNSAENGDGEYILCKSCGKEIFSVNNLIYKKSPLALQTWNDTLFQQSEMMRTSQYNKSSPESTSKDSKLFTTVQLLRNPHGNTFELITVRRADLVLLNNTKSIEDTWFPNFSWTIAVCPHCFNHLGWFFESILSDHNESFFALILDQLVNQQFADTLVVMPKIKMF